MGGRGGGGSSKWTSIIEFSVLITVKGENGYSYISKNQITGGYLNYSVVNINGNEMILETRSVWKNEPEGMTVNNLESVIAYVSSMDYSVINSRIIGRTRIGLWDYEPSYNQQGYPYNGAITEYF